MRTKIIVLIVALVLIVSLSACGSNNDSSNEATPFMPENISKIEQGMTLDEVESLIGTHDEIAEYDETTIAILENMDGWPEGASVEKVIWRTETGEEGYSVDLVNGEVFFVYGMGE